MVGNSLKTMVRSNLLHSDDDFPFGKPFSKIAECFRNLT